MSKKQNKKVTEKIESGDGVKSGSAKKGLRIRFTGTP
jgi:hypothetical protein